ncbi:hypothetical protein MRX96_006014 [Rhipicephalus microplus]
MRNDRRSNDYETQYPCGLTKTSCVPPHTVGLCFLFASCGAVGGAEMNEGDRMRGGVDTVASFAWFFLGNATYKNRQTATQRQAKLGSVRRRKEAPGKHVRAEPKAARRVEASRIAKEREGIWGELRLRPRTRPIGPRWLRDEVLG